MTVAELIISLQQLPDNAIVVRETDYGFTTHLLSVTPVKLIEQRDFHAEKWPVYDLLDHYSRFEGSIDAVVIGRTFL